MPTSLPSVSTFTSPAAAHSDDKAKNPGRAAVNWLRRDIVRGVFLPGERLKVEQLTKFYDLGLSPTREAILILSESGLIEHEHQRGHRVAPVSIADYEDVLETYNRIRRVALEMAMERATDTWEEQVLVKLHRLMKVKVVGVDDDPEAREAWQRAYLGLQSELVGGCGSPLLTRFYGDIGSRLERYINLYGDLSSDQNRDHGSEHWQIIKAMTSRDFGKLQALLDQIGIAASPMRESVRPNLEAWLAGQGSGKLATSK